MSRCVVTVGVSSERQFGPYLDRFERTMREHAHAEMTVWRSTWPPGSPAHSEVHYAFKLHAVASARDEGYSRVLWLDCSCHAIRSLEPIWEIIEREGCFLAHGEDRLGSWSSDAALASFGVTRDEAMGMRLLSGTIYGFNFDDEKSCAFFDRMRGYATAECFNGTHRPSPMIRGGRGSEDPRCEGHRSDEPYATLVARDLGMKSRGDYALFTGGMGEYPTTIIKSGYDL